MSWVREAKTAAGQAPGTKLPKPEKQRSTDCSAIAAMLLSLWINDGQVFQLPIEIGWSGIVKSSPVQLANDVPAFNLQASFLFGLLIALNRLFNDQRGWLAKSGVKADTCNA